MESERELFREAGCQDDARRQFLRFLLASPLLGSAALATSGGIWPKIARAEDAVSGATEEAQASPSAGGSLGGAGALTNVLQFEGIARTRLSPDTFHFVADGADDMKTMRANREAFDHWQIRARRLVDVSKLDTTVNILGRAMETPIILAPVGSQQQLHPQGELASARVAASKKTLYVVSTMASFSVGEIATAGKGPIWFQLYTSPDRGLMRGLLMRAVAAVADAVVLTVDGPVLGNREREIASRARRMGRGRPRVPNFEGLIKGPLRIGDATLTWDVIGWLKANTSMKVVIKGVVTHEDAKLCVEHGGDGLIISNHGGRQEESNRGTLECLPEIVEAVDGRVPVLIDGGFRRGTDIFKALALGAQAICIGRPYLWGLATFGEDGVAKVLDLLREELVRIMKLAGTPSIRDIGPALVRRRECAPA